MKKLATVRGALVASAGLIFTSTSWSAVAAPGFDVGDLKGRCAFVIAGEATAGPVTGPLAATGIIEADGHGNFPFATRTITVGGKLIVQNDTPTCTYVVNPDGTGTATFIPTVGPTQSFDFAIVDRDEFHAVATTLGVVASGPAKRRH